MQRIKAAVVQTCSTEDRDANLAQAERLVRGAAADGATFIALPENVSFLRIATKENFPEPVEGGRTVGFFSKLAAELKVAILIGSFQQHSPHPSKVYNTSVLIGPSGEIVQKYEKIHLFDIDIPGVMTLRESDTITPGAEPVTARLYDTTFGLTICYDLRFPELYRRLLDQGAEVLCVPAAFTLMTGKDHWEVLLRARAIENQCWLLAPGQWGPHGGSRYSYGHSVIIDPWGHVVAKCSDGEGWATAWLEPDKLASVRRNLPCGEHRRLKA
jgi:predicted amidohydrolase